MPSIRDYASFGWQLLSGRRSREERDVSHKRDADFTQYLGSKRPLRILELGNGRLRGQYMLLKADGHQVYGVDLMNRKGDAFASMAYRIARRAFIWRAGLAANLAETGDLICADAGHLPFRCGAFDVVTSNAAFEHFFDVPRVVTEVSRVLRPGGLAWIVVHLFTSLSGAHNITLTQNPLRKMPAGVEPWDHLRRRRLPRNVPLNEWRRDQYVRAFTRDFGIVKIECVTREGEEFLTDEVRSELIGYDWDELTCGTLLMVGTKRTAGI